MQARRKNTNPVSAEDDSFIPEGPPDKKDPDAMLRVVSVKQCELWMCYIGVEIELRKKALITEFSSRSVRNNAIKYSDIAIIVAGSFDLSFENNNP